MADMMLENKPSNMMGQERRAERGSRHCRGARSSNRISARAGTSSRSGNRTPRVPDLKRRQYRQRLPGEDPARTRPGEQSTTSFW